MSNSPSEDEAAFGPETRRVGKFNFRIFNPRSPRMGEPTVTLEKGKRITLSGAAAKLLNRAERVELMYDPDRRAVGIWAAKPGDPQTLKTLKTGNRSTDSAGFSVSAGRFFDALNLDTSVSRRFACEFEDDVMIFQLDAPIAILTRTRSRKAEK